MADSIRPTAPKNEALAWLASRLQDVDRFARKPFGYDNPPVAMLSDLLGVPAIQRTAERAAYGEPLTTGKGWTTRMRPDTEEALLSAPQFIPPLAAVARATKGMPVGMAIKPKGGNWLEGSVEEALRGLRRKAADDMGPDEALAEIQRVHGGLDVTTPEHRLVIQPAIDRLNEMSAVNTWIDKQLTRYIKNEMATPEDPLRALAERGVLHVSPEDLNFRPEMHGKYLEPGQTAVAQSPSAKVWEGASDNAVGYGLAKNWLADADDWVADVGAANAEANSWLSKVPPDTRVYYANEPRNLSADLGFTHLIDELSNATNPASGLPRELLLKYESLPQVSVPQAVERVSNINAWRAAQMAAAKKAAREGIPVHKEYPEGYKWMSAPDTAADERALQYVTDVGCEGGWCTQGPDTAKRYGGGGNQLYVLHNPKGEAVTQIAVAPMPARDLNMSSSQYERLLEDYASAVRRGEVDPDKLDPRSWYLAAGEARPPRIVEIKGKSNRAPNPEYLPFVQDFVKSGKWSEVGDLSNAGLVRIGDNYVTQDRFRDVAGDLMPGYFDNLVRNRVTDLSDDDARIIQQLQEPGFAQGGAVLEYQAGGAVKAAKAAAKSLGELMRRYITPQEEALRLAQQRAALPVEQGGLGLAADNTAAERAMAMGFDIPAYHGTQNEIDFPAFRGNPAKQGQTFVALDAAEANVHAPGARGSRVMPLLVKPGKMAPGIADWGGEDAYAELIKRYGRESFKVRDDYKSPINLSIMNPANIRSRFAAFDPFRKDLATATAMGVAAPDLLAAEEPKPKSNRLGEGSATRDAVEASNSGAGFAQGGPVASHVYDEAKIDAILNSLREELHG